MADSGGVRDWCDRKCEHNFLEAHLPGGHVLTNTTVVLAGGVVQVPGAHCRSPALPLSRPAALPPCRSRALSAQAVCLLCDVTTSNPARWLGGDAVVESCVGSRTGEHQFAVWQHPDLQRWGLACSLCGVAEELPYGGPPESEHGAGGAPAGGAPAAPAPAE